MGYPEVEEITGTCFVCNDQVAVGQLVYATEESTHGITDCGKHSEDEIQLKIKEIEEASCVKLIAKMRFGSEVQASANHYASRTPQPINDGGPRMLPKDTQIPYREADYLVQNMPPPANDSTANGALLLQTEKILNLAYGWSQIQVAVNSLTNARDILSKFDHEELPARSLKQRMREIRSITKGLSDLALMSGKMYSEVGAPRKESTQSGKAGQDQEDSDEEL